MRYLLFDSFNVKRWWEKPNEGKITCGYISHIKIFDDKNTNINIKKFLLNNQ